MTIKELMTAVGDDPVRFPKGWNTEAKEVFVALGADHFERRQRKVWVLTVHSPLATEEFAVYLFRTRAKAKEAMEKDIADALAERETGIHGDAGLTREDELRARIGDDIEWEVTHEELRV